MPRRRRSDRLHSVHHAFTRGDEQRDRFREPEEADHMVGLIGEVAEELAWRVEAYVLMPNHLHLVVAPSGTLSHGMHRLLSSFANWWNTRADHSGHVFEGRFGSHVVDDPDYHAHVLCYVGANPVRHGFTGDPAAWPWSSYAATAGLVPAPAFLAVEAARAAVGGIDAYVRGVRAASLPAGSGDGHRPPLAVILDGTPQQARRAHDAFGYTVREIAAAMHVSPATAWRFLQV